MSTTATRPEPSGPICAFGSRLAYTYFPAPTPLPEQLNVPLTPSSTSTSTSNSTTTSATTTATTTGSITGGGDYWFTIDDQLVYLSFFQDYGPLNIGCLYRFCLHLHNLLEDPAHRHQRIFLYSSDEPDKKVNAALLMSLYAMVVMRWSVADVLHPISCLELQPYRDAGYSRSDYHLHPQHILYGLSRALSHQLLDLSTFDLAAYEKAEKVEEGDWNWITPGLIAFASPVEAGWNASTGTGGGTGGAGGGRLTRSFRNVLEEFEIKNVKVVVRLNKKLYDRQHFLERGIEHVEMYFDDGTNPSMEMCREFIDLSDRVISSGGAVAVHCKAGLGRTGTLIGAYLIYKHGFTADEAIGFMRLMRPGSCVGPQQHFLYENQLEWVRWSAQDELRAELSLSSQPSQPQASTSTSTAAARERDCSAPPRPITPPNESELREQARQRSSTPHHHPSAAPMTPRRQTGNNVPGQPRKTPGRSRHGISAPEEKDKDSPNPVIIPTNEGAEKDVDGDGDEEMDVESAAAAMREEAEVEGVSLIMSSPNKKKRDSLTTGGNAGGRRTRRSLQLVDDEEKEGEEEEDPLTMLPTSPKKLLHDLQSAATTTKPPSTSTSTRPKTPASASTSTSTSTTTTNRPTRIARSTQSGTTTTNNVIPTKPLTSITDNKPPRSSTTSTRSGASTTGADSTTMIGRSRGAKNLNTVFESVEASGSGSATNKGPTASTRSRYPLRNVSGRTTPTQPPPPPTTSNPGVNTGTVAPNSPSKLPTRIPAKRTVAPSSPGPQHHHSQSLSQQGGGFNPGETSSKDGGRGGGGGFTSLANGLAKLNKGGRNVRRRRSSMGSQDFVQAG